MSTHAIIGTARDSGFEGRYVHCDGYPTGIGPKLLEIYSKCHRGLEGFIDVVVRPDMPGYWTALRVLTPTHVDGWTSENGDSWGTEEEDWGASYVYLVSLDGISILAVDYNVPARAWVRLGFVAWDAQDTNWGAIENREYVSL